MSNYIQKHFISAAILLVALLIIVGVALTFYNRQVMEDAIDAKNRAAFVMLEIENLYTNIRQMDVSARGYAVMKEDAYLYYPVAHARRANARIFRNLDSLFRHQGYSDPVNYEPVKKGMDRYVDLYKEMADYLRAGEDEKYKELLREDFGKHFFTTYRKFADPLNAFQEKSVQEANEKYRAASTRNSIAQVSIFLVGIPTLLVILRRLRREETKRKNLVLNLEENNRKFLFNPGTQVVDDADLILTNSITNLQKASSFVTNISEGKYDAQWDGLNESNQPLNKDNLVGRLLQMREQMKRVKQEDERRIWVTEGLSKFSVLVRNHQNNLNELAEKATSFLVKYLSSQQGALFVAREEEEHGRYLEMISCFAFDRKKFVTKRVAIGDGLVGQVFLEGSTTMLRELPNGYTLITSGLGESTPSCVLVVPLKFNDQILAVLEVASFHIYSQTEVEFVEKAGEFVAAALANAENNERTQKLLEQFKVQTEQLRAQEEELRQNMEELEATQEQMKRKERELESRLMNTAN